VALPKKKSRAISVDGREFRWLKRAVPHGEELRVEASTKPMSHLVAPLGDVDGVPPVIGPGLVAALVRTALAKGWSPDSNEPREFVLDDVRTLVLEHDLRPRSVLSCLIITPFDAGAARVRRALASAVRELGVQVIEAAEAKSSESRTSMIMAGVANADFVVADVSRQNPNVFYELGYAQALGKSTIIVIDDSTETALPSSLAGNLFITYSDEALPALGAAVQRALLRAIRSMGSET
jgi:hypothetical protein